MKNVIEKMEIEFTGDTSQPGYKEGLPIAEYFAKGILKIGHLLNKTDFYPENTQKEIPLAMYHGKDEDEGNIAYWAPVEENPDDEIYIAACNFDLQTLAISPPTLRKNIIYHIIIPEEWKDNVVEFFGFAKRGDKCSDVVILENLDNYDPKSISSVCLN